MNFSILRAVPLKLTHLAVVGPENEGWIMVAGSCLNNTGYIDS